MSKEVVAVAKSQWLSTVKFKCNADLLFGWFFVGI
jgi:hypothetical protein